MSPLVIEVGKQRTGATFQLSPRTQEMLSSRFPGRSTASSVFVSFDTREPFESLHGPMWDQIVMLLTGLSERQIQKLGGFTVVSTPDREVLFDSNAA